MKIINGTDVNPLSVNDALNSINKETSQGLIEFEASFHKTVLDSELKISNDNSVDAVKKYVQGASDILSKDPLFGKSAGGQSLFSGGMINTNGIDVNILDGYIVYLDQAIKELKNISVPSKILIVHKKMTEIFMSNKEVFLNIRKMEEDPLRAMLAMNQLEKNIGEIKNLGVSLADLSKNF